jgi:hypothetical protein
MATTIQDAQQLQRAHEVTNALASVRLEGLEPSNEVKLLFQRYVDGELTSDELDSACEEFLQRKYGPVSLPGNERP